MEPVKMSATSGKTTEATGNHNGVPPAAAGPAPNLAPEAVALISNQPAPTPGSSFRDYMHAFFKMIDEMYDFCVNGGKKRGETYNNYLEYCNHFSAQGPGEHRKVLSDIWMKYKELILADTDSWLVQGRIVLSVDPFRDSKYKPKLELSTFYNKVLEDNSDQSREIASRCRRILCGIFYCMLEETQVDVRRRLAQIGQIVEAVPIPADATGNPLVNMVANVATVAGAINYDRIVSENNVSKIFSNVMEDLAAAGLPVQMNRETQDKIGAALSGVANNVRAADKRQRKVEKEAATGKPPGPTPPAPAAAAPATTPAVSAVPAAPTTASPATPVKVINEGNLLDFDT